MKLTPYITLLCLPLQIAFGAGADQSIIKTLGNLNHRLQAECVSLSSPLDEKEQNIINETSLKNNMTLENYQTLQERYNSLDVQLQSIAKTLGEKKKLPKAQAMVKVYENKYNAIQDELARAEESIQPFQSLSLNKDQENELYTLLTSYHQEKYKYQSLEAWCGEEDNLKILRAFVGEKKTHLKMTQLKRVHNTIEELNALTASINTLSANQIFFEPLVLSPILQNALRILNGSSDCFSEDQIDLMKEYFLNRTNEEGIKKALRLYNEVYGNKRPSQHDKLEIRLATSERDVAVSAKALRKKGLEDMSTARIEEFLDKQKKPAKSTPRPHICFVDEEKSRLPSNPDPLPTRER